MIGIAKFSILLAFSVGALGFNFQQSLVLIGLAYFLADSILGETK